MLEKVKTALRIKTTAFDSEILDLIEEAKADLEITGIANERAENDPLISRAIKTYCKLNFGEPENPARLQAAYDEQKKQLSMTSGYTDWGK